MTLPDSYADSELLARPYPEAAASDCIDEKIMSEN